MDYIFSDSAVKGMEKIMGQKKGGCYIFSGEKGLGKSYAAKMVVSSILNKNIDAITSSPDFYYVCATDGVIKTEELEGLRRFTSFVPAENDIKVCIIDDADTMTMTAQNSLLKTLEEESEYNLFILVAHTDMLETIQSRSFTVNFYPLQEAVLKELFPSVSSTVISLSDGHPGRVEMMNSSKMSTYMENVLNCFSSMEKKRELFEAFHLVKEKDKSNFYDLFDSAGVIASIKLICSLFYKALVAEDTIHANHIRELYSEEQMLGNIERLQNAVITMKRKGQFSRNDFFDLIRYMAE